MRLISSKDRNFALLAERYCLQLKETVYLIRTENLNLHRCLRIAPVGKADRYVMLDRIYPDHFLTQEDLRNNF